MILETLSLTAFRKFEELHLKLAPGVNYFVGLNGVGKSSIVEAVWILTTGHSFRTHKLSETIQSGQAVSTIESHFQVSGVKQQLLATLKGSKKQIKLNKRVVPSSASILGTLLGVTITPEDLQIIKGAPSFRRHFLDIFIAKFDPLYIHHFKRYGKALEGRNTLLKQRDFKTIVPFEIEMARSAAYIVEKRCWTLTTLNKEINPLYNQIASKSQTIELSYSPPINLAENFAKMRNQEARIGYTLTGPHRDDFSIRLNEKEARQFGSEGEKKSLLIALKLAAFHLLKEITNQPPLLLIDDFEAHLDKKRSNTLLELIQGTGQLFITSTDAKPLKEGQLFIIE